MRMCITLAVSDSARRQIARAKPHGKRTVRGAMASRELITEYLQERLDALSKMTPWWDEEPLRPDEVRDVEDAVGVLRKAGKSDADIRAWLLLQRARFDLNGRESHE